MITVQVEVEHRATEAATAIEVGKMIALAGDYMQLAERLPNEGASWHMAGRIHIHREDFGEDE